MDDGRIEWRNGGSGVETSEIGRASYSVEKIFFSPSAIL